MNPRPRSGHSTRLFPLLAAASLAVPLPALAVSTLDHLAQARDVICSFNKSAQPDARPSPRRRDDDLMVIIEGIGIEPGTARVVTSQAVGAKPARVYASDTGVHIVEDKHDSVFVTTVLKCDAWKPNGEGGKCTRFAAVIAWHFDRSVHRNPDPAFLRLPGSSYTGHCEPWNLE